MSFILGFSLVLPLVMFTILLYFISKFVPKEAIQLPILFMCAGDGILVALWFFGLNEIADSYKHFKLGIAASFCFISFGRAIYFMLKFQHDNKNEQIR
tara:strand:+ start:380 stop:673 length:294 start_codon:yes stop_codon:yes gene_type:complete